ncbi:hypothetical protein BT93_L5118 [Corymbia citriodora subsp. variegata]|uniref:Uncharacterized protein n=1 Tax=Corymbia citriodora subsp. variegata TaxID=360336 RepID=A0A8T0CV81_CORYI|nr:hypothetical protein BT93_L5118 [Corymbia citriodora subsp. variegata]
MGAIRYKELLGWYVITLKLRETVESRLPNKSTYAGEIVPHCEPKPPKSEWIISIEEKLAQGRHDDVPGSWAKLSIYQIPRHLKHGDEKAWVPQVVSLGPYHHGDEHLRHMEWHKWRCLHRILERSGQGIGLYLDSVKKVEQRARACYEGRISMSCDKFVEMMVLDGCFVIELFQGFVKGFEKLGYPYNDPVFSMRGSILQIQRDMIMLENQIPLFILDRLLGLQLGDPNQKERVATLAIRFFYPLRPKYYIFILAGRKILRFDPLYYHGKVHCLEVFRGSRLQLGPKRSKTTQRSQGWQQLTRCLTELREDGIKIMPSYLDILGDIQFEDGILLIPQFEIHEWTRSLFLNLIAFEQSHFDCRNHITSYVIFMHNLMNSPEDVRGLRDSNIIKYCRGSDAEVADLFKRLCEGVVLDKNNSYLNDLSFQVENYCFFNRVSLKTILARKWKTWKAILKILYFDSPYSIIISIIVAFVLLVLTFIQAFYAVYGYYRVGS